MEYRDSAPIDPVAVFGPDPDLDALRESVRRFCERNWSEAAVRAAMTAASEPGADQWRRLATEIGILSLSVPEHLGGDGGGIRELALVAEEFGRCLVPLPLLSGYIAIAGMLNCAESPEATDYISRFAKGERRLAFIGSTESGAWDPGRTSLTAREGADGWTVTGSAAHVVDAGAVDTFIVAVPGAPYPLFIVDANTDEVSVEPTPTLDLTRRQGAVRFANAAACPLATSSSRQAPTATVSDVAAVLLASELVGVAAKAVDTSVAYASTRYQFGRPIGSFQAVKHHLANSFIELELARSAAQYAAYAVAHELNDATLAARTALVAAVHAARLGTATEVQVHGGIGATWEHPAHLYYKRAIADAALWSGPRRIELAAAAWSPFTAAAAPTST